MHLSDSGELRISGFRREVHLTHFGHRCNSETQAMRVSRWFRWAVHLSDLGERHSIHTYTSECNTKDDGEWEMGKHPNYWLPVLLLCKQPKYTESGNGVIGQLSRHSVRSKFLLPKEATEAANPPEPLSIKYNDYVDHYTESPFKSI